MTYTTINFIMILDKECFMWMGKAMLIYWERRYVSEEYILGQM